MPTFLYSFGYETPLQNVNNAQHGWDDEDSRAVLIDAEDEQAAQAWGKEIAEYFVKLLYPDDRVSWKKLGYADWVETPGHLAKAAPHVRVGEFPDLRVWL